MSHERQNGITFSALPGGGRCSRAWEKWKAACFTFPTTLSGQHFQTDVKFRIFIALQKILFYQPKEES